jgi:7,8-dihydroneopterin aldolase/epimerase/oxygenase
VTDRVVLRNMAFDARHGVHDWEQVTPQRFEVDIELFLDLHAAGSSDDLAMTVDYGEVYRLTSDIVVSRSYRLLEALATAIATETLTALPSADEVVVRVRKPDVKLGGPLDYAGVEIRRGRSDATD